MLTNKFKLVHNCITLHCISSAVHVRGGQALTGHLKLNVPRIIKDIFPTCSLFY